MDYSEPERKRVYRQPLNYENGVLLPLIRDIAYWRVTDGEACQKGVMTLALLLPKELRKKSLEFWNRGNVDKDLTENGKKDFDDLFVFILQLLEDNNICFPKISFHQGFL